MVGSYRIFEGYIKQTWKQ